MRLAVGAALLFIGLLAKAHRLGSIDGISEIDRDDEERVRSGSTMSMERRKRMGLTADEEATVNGYLEKLSALADKKYGVAEESDEPRPSFSRRLKDDSGRRRKSINPEENGRHFEGDIVLFPDQAEALYQAAMEEGKSRKKRKFIGSNIRRWDASRPIVYSFDGSHTLREQKIIELALEHWHNITCLDFVRRDDSTSGNRIVFTDVDGCASNVGRHPLGEEQLVSLAPECIRLGVIAHEVAHALGFWHEQSRPDRDNYVNVRWENIDKDSKGQFLKEDPEEVDNGDVPYDYGSIMHYRSKAFARYDDLYTLNTFITDYQKTIGQRDQLSFNDIALMNKIYCSASCRVQLPCQRGGYTDPRRCDRCRCPDGFTGQLCDQVMPGYGSICGGQLALGKQWTRIASPGYPREFKEGQECSWLLTAPLGYIVEMQFYGDFEMYCKVRHSLCMDYVEVRNSTDFANTGMRYCCFGTPLTIIRSATEDMLVLFRSFYRGGKGFQARARAVAPAGQWQEWHSWTACSATCGACGSRIRTRTCPPGAVCPGKPIETEVCGTQPCDGLCTHKKVQHKECSGFLAVLRGSGCSKPDPVPTEACDRPCCPGFILQDGYCQREQASSWS